MKKRENGFTLFEVLISMFITVVALLGLAMLNIYILKSSQSSFNYTVATIRANTFVDAVWLDLCNAQSSASGTYSTIRSNWVNELTSAGMATDSSNPPAAYAQDMSVIVSWSDARFGDDDNDQVTMNVQFPNCE